MKNIYQSISLLCLVLFTACTSEQSLQGYFVANTENPNFISFGVPASILELDKAALSPIENEAISSLRKLDILAFKKTAANDAEYALEKTKVKAILKNEDFVELMKMNTPYGKATVKYLGDDDAIDEVVIFGDNKEKGFAVIRVLGNNMNPANMLQLLQAVQKSDYDGAGLEKLGSLFKD